MYVGINFCEHTNALRYTSTPLSIGLAGSTARSLECVACKTHVGCFAGVECIDVTPHLTVLGLSGKPQSMSEEASVTLSKNTVSLLHVLCMCHNHSHV